MLPRDPYLKNTPKFSDLEVTGILYKKGFRGRWVRGAEAHQRWVTVHPFQSLSYVWLFATPWAAARRASLSITNYQSLLKLVCIRSMMTSNHLILCHPLLFLPLIFPSIRVIWPEYWSFSFSISLSNVYSVSISFWIDWFDHLAFQGTPKSLLQHLSLKASILRHSAFFIVQLSLP